MLEKLTTLFVSLGPDIIQSRLCDFLAQDSFVLLSAFLVGAVKLLRHSLEATLGVQSDLVAGAQGH